MSEKVEGSVYHEQRKKIAAEQKANKKKSDVIDQYVEVGPNTGHVHGPKWVLVTKTKQGTSRQLLGRPKNPKAMNKIAGLKNKYKFVNV